MLESAGQILGAKESLSSYIADKRMLLLFDNFEQVIEAAPDLSSLLGECPRLELMATSREPLHVAGEQEYPVPPFTLDEGVGFFAARARAVKPDFEIDESVPKICRRLTTHSRSRSSSPRRERRRSRQSRSSPGSNADCRC